MSYKYIESALAPSVVLVMYAFNLLEWCLIQQYLHCHGARYRTELGVDKANYAIVNRNAPRDVSMYGWLRINTDLAPIVFQVYGNEIYSTFVVSALQIELGNISSCNGSRQHIQRSSKKLLKTEMALHSMVHDAEPCMVDQRDPIRTRAVGSRKYQE